MADGLKPVLDRSIEGVVRWVERHHYRAYDPGDGNMSPLRVCGFGSLFFSRLLTGAVLRSPVNIRPVLGIRPHRSTKGTGYMAWGYLKMYEQTRDPSWRERAVSCLEWLRENRSPGFPQYCWGNHFDFCTRSGRSRALSPIMPWTALIGQTFLEAYRVLGETRFLEVAGSVAEWILAVPREKTPDGLCLSYVPNRQLSIHNANLLGAAVLAGVGAVTGNREALTVARQAIEYSCAHQREDGGWAYAEGPQFAWNDNFHTGYNLDGLKRYQTVTGDRSFEVNLRRGLDYFMGHFFEPDGRPKYYDTETYPTDIQCAAQAIDTLAFFSDLEPGALVLSGKVARWTMRHMQDPDGHFYYRDLGWMVSKIPMLHWGQATMFKALANLRSRCMEMSRADVEAGAPQGAAATS